LLRAADSQGGLGLVRDLLAYFLRLGLHIFESLDHFRNLLDGAERCTVGAGKT